MCGYLVAVAVFLVRRQRNGDVVDGGTRYMVMVGAGIGAMIGSRLLAALCEPLRVWQGLAEGHLYFGKTIVGALLGGLIAVELVKRRAGVSEATGDPLVVPMAVGIAIGRVGCFLAAQIDDTGGLPTNLPWAVVGPDGIGRHPVALYEIAFVLLLAPIATAIGRRGARGDAFKLFLSSYLLFRFFCDFLKPMPPRIYGGLSTIQLACAAGLLYYASVWLRRMRSVEVTA